MEDVPPQLTEESPLLPTVMQVGDDGGDGTPKNGYPEQPTALVDDAIDIFNLAVPIFTSRVSYTGMKTTDTALLGHVSGKALSAAALSDLYTMCTAVLIRGRALTILVGQTSGANNHYLAFVYLRISLLILAALSIVVAISWSFTEQVWIGLGQSEDVSKMAGYYSFIFIFAIPAQLLFDQLAQYLSAQRIMRPEVVASLIALICNLILGITFVLGVPFLGFDGFGFEACPLVTVVVVYLQCTALYVYWMKTGKNTFHNSTSVTSGSNQHWLTEGITMERVKTFCEIYFPAALSISSDFWRMGAIGAIAATLGEREVGLFNASYRVLWITLIFVGALSQAAGIKIGRRLGTGDANGARQVAAVGVGLVATVLVTLSAIVYCNMRLLGMLFTSDESYLDLFVECRTPFALLLFFMNLAVGIEMIPMAMGRTGAVFYAGFIASWCGQVPGVIFLTRFWRADLYGLYAGVAAGYALLVILYGWLAYSSDYRKYSDLARRRAEVS